MIAAIAWWFFATAQTSFYVMPLAWQGPYSTREQCESDARMFEASALELGSISAKPVALPCEPLTEAPR